MIRARILAWLLVRANARMSGAMNRTECYALKDRILRKYGVRDGSDIQHIREECWGYEQSDGCEGATCRRCRGTGIYNERWIELERWNVLGHVFHRPSERYVRGPEHGHFINRIEGRIRHDSTTPRAAAEALLWLLLICDRRLFWREFAHAGMRSGWYGYPLLVLQAALFKARMGWQHAGLPTWRRCSCGRFIIRPFENGYWMACRRCSPPIRKNLALAMEVDDDLPF